jgi:hypothetical protein
VGNDPGEEVSLSLERPDTGNILKHADYKHIPTNHSHSESLFSSSAPVRRSADSTITLPLKRPAADITECASHMNIPAHIHEDDRISLISEAESLQSVSVCSAQDDYEVSNFSLVVPFSLSIHGDLKCVTFQNRSTSKPVLPVFPQLWLMRGMQICLKRRFISKLDTVQLGLAQKLCWSDIRSSYVKNGQSHHVKTGNLELGCYARLEDALLVHDVYQVC